MKISTREKSDETVMSLTELNVTPRDWLFIRRCFFSGGRRRDHCANPKPKTEKEREREREEKDCEQEPRVTATSGAIYHLDRRSPACPVERPGTTDCFLSRSARVLPQRARAGIQ
ncbi:hypothetical protein DBV15_09445 [Temnothorax longispinosus]|uniref:Uncharacterized protein n=1 Tax=Temnothorax longispinosus TaxID=300112 RepID=A0A4S2K8P1_9HYME|nr:hypothetical protein DBV15_09445 [Temnothorax longispinosus]